MSKKTKRFLVTTNFEYGNRVLHSFTIMSEKEIEKFDKRMEKHFNKNTELIVQFGEKPEEYVNISSLEELYNHIEIEDVGVDSATTISDLLNVEMGECSINALYCAAFEQKLINKENSKKKVEVSDE